MKRSDESRMIKIPDANAVAAAVAGVQPGWHNMSQEFHSARSSPMAQPNLASITPIFQNRPNLITHQQIANIPVTGQEATVQVQRPGVTIYRGDTNVVGTTSGPISVHSGVVVTPASAPQTQQSVIHGIPAMMAHSSSIKSEPINLPNAPINVQYVSAFPSSVPNNGPSVVIKTTSGGNLPGPNIQLQSPNVPGRVHSSSPLHQNINFSSPTVMRSVPSTTPQPPQSMPQRPPSTSGNMVTGIVNPARDTNTPGGGSGANSSFQRLKVEDALSYLDQVKFKFGNQPQVYNDFLDIMKEFKSQSIDTPGVIARVSSLFRGHPELIVGFNTFLPPGYKIEIHSTDSIAISIPGMVGPTVQTIVHTPHGIQKLTTTGSGTLIPAPKPATSRPPQIATPPEWIYNLGLTAPPLGASKFHLQPAQGSGGLSSYQPSQPIHGSGPPISKGPYHQTVPLPVQSPSIQSLGQEQPSQRPSENTPPRSGVVGSQPVEFNHAINYVNKIKTRFQNQPEIYKQFLEILHTYQKDQKAIKEGQRPTGPYLTEAEVYRKVAELFENQEDLLSEFGQFLPGATGENSMHGTGLGPDFTSPSKRSGSSEPGKHGGQKFESNIVQGRSLNDLVHPMSGLKRHTSGVAQPPPPKKVKSGFLRDVSLAEASKYGALTEYAFFDKVRRALRNQDVYDNFLRCLILFNREVISRAELIQLTTPILGRHSELFKWFKDFVGHRGGETANSSTVARLNDDSQPENRTRNFDDDNRRRNDTDRNARDRLNPDSALEIDFTNCKRLGASYCAYPRDTVHPSCSGRTLLCKEVLNDTWVSFPSWSEDSQFVSSRKTQFEEAIYRTEDERFEFDMVLETNKDTIKVLDCVQRKMSRMPPEEAARYNLDECLGGSSPTIHQRAVRRLYGDKAHDVIEGLKKNPVVAVPLVLRRLRAKDQEWRDALKNFHKVWRDQNEKYYLKSLDHQCLIFKQSDIRNLRSKSLLNEIGTLYDERHEQNEDNHVHSAFSEGPHLTFTYSDTSVLEDANNLLIHHVKRQTSIHKEEKQKIKALLKQFLMDCFKHPRQELSDDEREEDDESNKEDDNETDNNAGRSTSLPLPHRSDRSKRKQKDGDDNSKTANVSDPLKPEDDKILTEADIKIELKDGRRTPLHSRDMEPDESYTLFMANNNWYLFFRLHQILCDRLSKMHTRAGIIATLEAKDRKDAKPSAAEALRLKPRSEIAPEDYYPAFLDMVKSLLDGNMDGQAYEDTLREMYGIHAYISFTLDKVVGNAVRQLQHLVSEESCVECHNLFMSESKNRGTGGTCGSAADRQIPELLFQKKAEKLLADENCMKLFIYHQSGLMTIELLDTETEGQESEKDEESTRKYQNYVDRFIDPGDEVSIECRRHLVNKPVFLPRCIRSFNKKSQAERKRAETSSIPDTIEKEKDPSVDEPPKNDSLKNESGDEPSYKDISYQDNTQCQFNLKNFKILYIVNSENCFYRRLALRRASESHKRVSQRKLSSFVRWHAGWVRQNVTDSQIETIDQWFMGKTDDMVSNKTTKITRTFTNKTPYRVHYKWTAEVTKQ